MDGAEPCIPAVSIETRDRPVPPQWWHAYVGIAPLSMFASAR